MNVNIENGELVIRIPRDYIKNSVEHAITTGTQKVVINEDQMMAHFQRKIGALDDDSHFNHALDLIADDAFENGESWLDSELELRCSQ